MNPALELRQRLPHNEAYYVFAHVMHLSILHHVPPLSPAVAISNFSFSNFFSCYSL
jgi:hypothetical protein